MPLAGFKGIFHLLTIAPILNDWLSSVELKRRSCLVLYYKSSEAICSLCEKHIKIKLFTEIFICISKFGVLRFAIVVKPATTRFDLPYLNICNCKMDERAVEEGNTFQWKITSFWMHSFKKLLYSLRGWIYSHVLFWQRPSCKTCFHLRRIPLFGHLLVNWRTLALFWDWHHVLLQLMITLMISLYWKQPCHLRCQLS